MTLKFYAAVLPLVLAPMILTTATAQCRVLGLSPDPTLWGGGTNPSGDQAIPIVAYDTTSGEMWLGSFGLNGVNDTTSRQQIGGDDVGMISMSIEGLQASTVHLNGIVGGLAWNSQYFNGQQQLFGVGVGGEFLEPACMTKLFTYPAGLTDSDFGTVAMGLNFVAGAPGVTIFGGHVQLGGAVLPCDFTADGICDSGDLNAMQSLGPIAPGIPAAGTVFDLNGDGTIDLADRDLWLDEAAEWNGLGSPYKLGDADLDGVVDVSDFNLWNANKFTGSLLWDAGDFNSDGSVDVSDFNLWNRNKFTASDGGDSVPEPCAGLLPGCCGLGLWLVRRSEYRGGKKPSQRSTQKLAPGEWGAAFLIVVTVRRKKF